MKKIVMLSNGTMVPHIKEEIEELFNNKQHIIFIPFSKTHHSENFEKTQRTFFKNINISMRSIHEYDDYALALTKCDGIIVSGGNTFLLLKTLQDNNLIEILKKKIETGTPYLGYSAGSNILTPNIRTTNDMSIVEPKSLNAIGVVPFNINPHYFDPILEMPGETKIQRIQEFHQENDNIVLGMPEGTGFKIEDNSMKLLNINSGLNDKSKLKDSRITLFEKNKEPQKLNNNYPFSDFLKK